jgi:hypothetical protein
MSRINYSQATERRNFQSRRGNNVARTGNVLPREKLQSDDVAKAQGAVLQGVFGRLKSPSKEMANLTGQNERACRNQIAGLNSMQLHKFFEACQSIPELQQWGAYMMGLRLEDPAAFHNEMQRGRQEIVLRFENGGLTLGGGA